MAVYAITGKLGSGKGKAAIDQIRRYLRAGKRVATNCDLFLEHLMPARDKSTVIRVPDKPVASDLYMIGSGNKFVEFEPILNSCKNGFEAIAPAPKILKGFDESHNGALVLDECGSWLNTRNFQDKGRAEMLEWAIHARKYGWDVFFVMQNISQVDKQLRDSLLEYVVRLNRLDRMKIPFVSSFLKFLTAGATQGNLPRVHIGVVRLGSAADGLVADRWVFRGDDLNNAYCTTQVFSDTYPHATHSLLSAWHLSALVGIPADFVGPVRPGLTDAVLLRSRVPPPKPPHPHMSKFLAMSLLLGAVLGSLLSHFWYQSGWHSVASAPSGPVEFSTTVRLVGLMWDHGRPTAVLSDGRVVMPMRVKNGDSGLEVQITPSLWVRMQ